MLYAGQTWPGDPPAQRRNTRGKRGQLARRELGCHRALGSQLLGGGPAQGKPEPIDVEPEAERGVTGAEQLVRGVNELACFLEDTEDVSRTGRAGSCRACVGQGVEARLVRARRGCLERVQLREDARVGEIREHRRRERRARQECDESGSAPGAQWTWVRPEVNSGYSVHDGILDWQTQSGDLQPPTANLPAALATLLDDPDGLEIRTYDCFGNRYVCRPLDGTGNYKLMRHGPVSSELRVYQTLLPEPERPTAMVGMPASCAVGAAARNESVRVYPTMALTLS